MKRLKNSYGLSMIEIMFATMLLYIVLIGLSSLFSSILKTVSISKVETQATIVANDLFEKARKMDYALVGMASSTDPTNIPTGTLPDTTTVVRGTYNFIVNNYVTWVDDDDDGRKPPDGTDDGMDYKAYKIVVNWLYSVGEAGFSRSSSITATTYIRENVRGNLFPSVAFGENSPSEDGVVVYGDDVPIQVRAEDPDGIVSNIRYSIDGFYPDGSVYSAQTTPVNYTFYWDTTQSSLSGTYPMFKDGVRNIRIEAWDNKGLADFANRTVCLDNYPPDNVDANYFNISQKTTTQLALSWNPVKDGPGSDYSDLNAYGYKLYCATYLDPTSTPTYFKVWETTASGYTLSDAKTSCLHTGLNSWSRYLYRIRPFSPRGMESSTFTASAETSKCVTKILVTVSANDKDNYITFNWGNPAFTAYGLSYALEKSADNVTWATMASAISSSYTYTFTKPVQWPRYFRITAEYYLDGELTRKENNESRVVKYDKIGSNYVVSYIE